LICCRNASPLGCVPKKCGLRFTSTEAFLYIAFNADLEIYNYAPGVTAENFGSIAKLKLRTSIDQKRQGARGGGQGEKSLLAPLPHGFKPLDLSMDSSLKICTEIACNEVQDVLT